MTMHRITGAVATMQVSKENIGGASIRDPSRLRYFHTNVHHVQAQGVILYNYRGKTSGKYLRHEYRG